MRRWTSAMVFALAMVASPAARAHGQDSLRAPVRKRTVAEDLQLFSQVLNQLRVNHPDSLDTHELLMAAVEALVEEADPHSYVIPAVRLDTAKQAASRAGKLYQLPIEFRFVDGAPLVENVAPGSKAVSLDLLPGDELVAADGHPIAAESSEELDLALAGPKGSKVTLSLRRRRADGSLARLERPVERERVEDQSAVPVAMLLDAQTGYIRVTTFLGDKVADDLHTALVQLEQKGMQRLVLDLRGNGGGRVDEAKRIAAEFLPRGAIVYTASGRKPEITDTGRVERFFGNTERKYPIVLMVDRGTASASELVAGALQDHDRALIVGRPTFGKSLIMRGFPLTDGSMIMLVVGRMETPCGRVIQREYRGISRRDYYREAGEVADTTGRPSCRTDGGRLVYGGGGIIPDIMLPESNGTPVWLARLYEDATISTWVGGYVDKTGANLATIDSLVASPKLPAAAISDFRAYATSSGFAIPADSTADNWLNRALVGSIAFVRFGAPGYYRLVALTDPGVRTAVEAFAKASTLLEPAK